MRRYPWMALAVVCLCCSGGTRETAHASGDQRPRQAHLVFSIVQSGEKGAREAGATLMLPVPRTSEGSPSGWSKLASYDSRGEAGGGGGAGAVAAWNDRSLPTVRVAARARLREDGLVHLAYAVESLEDAGTLAPAPGAPAGTPAQRLTSGPTLEGDLILPSKGANLLLGEVHDARGRKLEVKLTAEVTAVE